MLAGVQTHRLGVEADNGGRVAGRREAGGGVHVGAVIVEEGARRERVARNPNLGVGAEAHRSRVKHVVAVGQQREEVLLAPARSVHVRQR